MKMKKRNKLSNRVIVYCLLMGLFGGLVMGVATFTLLVQNIIIAVFSFIFWGIAVGYIAFQGAKR